MTRTSSIQSRVSWGLIAVSALIAFGLGGVAIFFNEQLEKTIMDTAINGQVAYVAAQGREMGSTVSIIEDAYRAYFVPYGEPNYTSVPDWIRQGIENQLEDVAHDGRIYEVSRRDVSGGSVFVATDVTAIEVSEANFMYAVLACAALLTLLAAYMSQRMARSMIRPLNDLANAVSQLAPSERGMRLEPDSSDRALSGITQTLNSYLAEMDAFVRREQHLSAMASHELRTPLAIVGGAVDVMLEREKNDAANAKTLQRIKDAVERMSGSIDALMLLSRLATAATDAFPPVPVHDVLQSQSDEAASLIGAKDIRLTIEAVEPLTIMTDEQLLGILIRNLLGNAIKYTHNGQIDIALTGGTLKISDTGCGLDIDNAQQLMEPHARGANVGHDGQGFGLYIAAEICRQFGWIMEFDRTDTGGTRVCVSFSASDGSTKSA